MLAQLRVILGLSWLTLGSGSGQKTFWGLLIQSINFYFVSMHLTSNFDIDQFYGHFWHFRLYLAILRVGLGQKNTWESQYSDHKLSFSKH